MITLPRLLSSFLLLGTALSFGVQAQDYCPKVFDVLERGKKDQYVLTPKLLEELHCTNAFEGKNFKIVDGTSDEAISFNHEDAHLRLKAANVYHHLTVARNFWINDINSTYVSRLPQIIIRLNITNAFSSVRQFKNAEQEKNYNNAWTIPEGQTPDFAREQRKWGKEIWFSPMKKIESRKEVVSKGNNPVHESLVLVKDPVLSYNTTGLIYDAMNFMVTPAINQSAVLEQALTRVGAMAIMFALLETSKHMDKMFMEKFFYIDTAMVPEIIYHEFAHIAMSDTMKTVHSVPVIEGMADYFAARIATREKMYDKLKGFSTNKAKNTKSKMFYHPYLEGSWNATSDFTLSLLWAGKENFDKQNEARVKKGQPELANYDELVHHAHFDMNENSDIQNGLIRALLKSCETKCNGKRAGMNTLHTTFEKKGLN